MKRKFVYLIFGIICMAIGTMLISPVTAHLISSKNAHTLTRHHISYFANKSWVGKYFVRKATKSGYLMIPAAAFRNMAANGKTVFSHYGSEIYDDGTGSFATLVAPVELPNSVTVTEVTYYYNDADAATNTTMELWRQEIATNNDAIVMAQQNSTGNSGTGSVTDTTITNPIVDSTSYEYFLRVYSTNIDLKAKGVKIKYTYSN